MVECKFNVLKKYKIGVSMKKITKQVLIALVFLSPFYSLRANAKPIYELATLLGTPNLQMPFIQEIVK